MLDKFATSEPGREICRNLMPETEIETINHLMDETTAARERITHKGKPSFAKVSNLDRILDSIENGNSVSAGELLVFHFLTQKWWHRHYTVTLRRLRRSNNILPL